MAVETLSRIFQVSPRGESSTSISRESQDLHLVAVIDVGSNSTRMEVLQLTSDYDLRVVSEVKALLRLASRKSEDGQLLPSAVSDLSRLIADFAVVARAANVETIRAVATSAMRDAANGLEMIEKIRAETGIELEIISGQREAEYGFLGAVFLLPAQDGVLIDIGGGSVEFSFFESRSLTDVYTLDLGALRVSNEFLSLPQPSWEEVDALRRHVRSQLKASGMPVLGESGQLLGAGGTIRNLTKIHRATRTYAFGRLHGSMMRYKSMRRIINGLQGLDTTNLTYMPGLNPERSDSILGGAIVAGEIAKFFGKRPILVSGRGIREGLAMSSVIDELPSIEEVRSRSIYALGARFDTWDRLRANRRAAIASQMSELLSDYIDVEMSRLIVHAARVVDTGRSIGYYERYHHAADILEQGEIGGFSHRDTGLMSATMRFSGSSSFSLERYRPELKKSDRVSIRRASILLRLADEMERRLGEVRYSKIEMQLVDDRFEVSAPELEAWEPGRHGARFRRVFGREFTVSKPLLSSLIEVSG